MAGVRFLMPLLVQSLWQCVISTRSTAYSRAETEPESDDLTYDDLRDTIDEILNGYQASPEHEEMRHAADVLIDAWSDVAQGQDDLAVARQELKEYNVDRREAGRALNQALDEFTRIDYMAEVQGMTIEDLDSKINVIMLRTQNLNSLAYETTQNDLLPENTTDLVLTQDQLELLLLTPTSRAELLALLTERVDMIEKQRRTMLQLATAERKVNEAQIQVTSARQDMTSVKLGMSLSRELIIDGRQSSIEGKQLLWDLGEASFRVDFFAAARAHREAVSAQQPAAPTPQPTPVYQPTAAPTPQPTAAPREERWALYLESLSSRDEQILQENERLTNRAENLVAENAVLQQRELDLAQELQEIGDRRRVIGRLDNKVRKNIARDANDR